MTMGKDRRRNSDMLICFSLALLLSSIYTGASAQKEECEIGVDGKETCRATEDPSACVDLDRHCKENARTGLCKDDFSLMREKCPKSCHLCDNESKIDGGVLIKNPFSEKPQKAVGAHSEKTRQRNQQVENYMYNEVYVNETFEDVRVDCMNRHELCTFWASENECQENPNYMQSMCAPACLSCLKLSFSTRCPFDRNAPGVWQKGDLDKMFDRITTDEEFKKYSPRIHSSPTPNLRDDGNDVVMVGPWVVTLENFISEEECKMMIELGAKEGYELSLDVGRRKFDGTYDAKKSSERTSTNAWCKEDCTEHDTTKAILARIENLTGIPSTNYESLQLLRYNVGQFYGKHHDYITFHKERPQGVRILTVFLYLNDVEEGGGTDFPSLNITVMPKRGRVLLWPSVLNSAPDEKDYRTDHQALPVLKGVKYGANAWVHQRDFQTPWSQGCSQ